MLLNAIAALALGAVQFGGDPASVTIHATVMGPKGIIASPTIRTLTGMPAEIRVDSEGYHSFSMKVTPRVNTDGSVTEQLELETETWLDSKTKNESKMGAVTRTQVGVPLTFLIKKNSTRGSTMLLNPPAGQVIAAGELKVTLVATVYVHSTVEVPAAAPVQVFCDVHISGNGNEMNPKIRTLTGEPATIKEDNGGHSVTVSILPTVEANGGLATKLTFSLGDELSISTMFHGKSGDSATFAYVINGSDGSVTKLDPAKAHTPSPGEIVVTVTPKIVSDGP